MKSSEGILTGIIGIWVGIWLGAVQSGISFSTFSFSLNEYLPAIVTLLAAFLGAWFAFKLNSDKEQKIEHNINLINGNSALFIMIMMYNNLKNYQEKVLDPERSNSINYISLKAINLPSDNSLQINIEILKFLLDKNPQLLFELKIEENRYNSAVGAINIRTTSHSEEMQPKLEENGFEEEKAYTATQMHEFLGNRLTGVMISNTKEVFKHVDSTVDSLSNIIDKLREEMLKTFPNETIINFEKNS